MRCHIDAQTLAKRHHAAPSFRPMTTLTSLLQCLQEGEAALERGDYAQAATLFAKAWDAAPDDPDVAIMLANVHRLVGDAVLARTVLLDAFQRANTGGANRLSAQKRYALGTGLLEAGAPAQAADCFAAVVDALPRDPAALAALASAKRALGIPEEAWPLVRRALGLAPRHPAYLLTAAQVRHDLGDRRGALQWLDAHDAVRPDHAPSRLQRAYTTLLGGASIEGWATFESRPLPVPASSAREWHGEPLSGQSILVTAEQGVGDQFQFWRFLFLLKECAPSRLVVECHADAVALLAYNGFEARARGSSEATDWHVPLLSLPHRLQLGNEVLGSNVPYVRAPVDVAVPPLPHREPGVRQLGLVWAGNPAFAARVTRDLDLRLLPELLATPRISWVSLQQGMSAEELPKGLHALPPLSGWSATATLLAQLDGLVTTDTGIAHLAGAMGIRSWVMLQYVPDWRWGLVGERTPWYPSITLVRSDGPRDWTSAVRKLRRFVQAEVAG